MEWSGPMASGKTQLALATALYTAGSRQSGIVYYIDSGTSFSACRLRDLWQGENFGALRETVVNGDAIMQDL
jgi:hypothetical protein